MSLRQRSYETRELVPRDYFRRLDSREIFPGAGCPLEIDLGCGDGKFLLAMAEAFPDRNFLGVERLLGRVRKVCRRAGKRSLSNVQVLRLESAYTVEFLLPRGIADRVHILFPDPWPKKRHARRRLVNNPLLTALAAVLKEDGEWLFKTDHHEYFEEVLDIVAECPLFQLREWHEDAFFYPRTDFEDQWIREGKEIHRARFAIVRT